MIGQEYAERMAERLPALLRGGANLSTVLSGLGDELSRLERANTLLMRSRWFDLAQGWAVPPDFELPEEWDELPAGERAASLPEWIFRRFGISPLEGEEGAHFLRRLDLVVRDSLAGAELGRIGALCGLIPDSDESAREYRGRLRKFVAIHKEGLCTAGAILRLAALVYRAEDDPRISWESGGAAACFMVRDTGGRTRELRLEAVDNPRRRLRKEFEGLAPGEWVEVENNGLDQAAPEISLTASHGDIVMPVLAQEGSGREVLFFGTIPQGSTLTLRHRQTPLLDGIPLYRPADPSSGEDDEAPPAVFMIEGRRHSPRAQPDPDTVFYIRDSPRAPIRSARFAILHRDYSLPALPRGRSRWRYDAIPASNLESYLRVFREGRRQYFRDLHSGQPAAPPARMEMGWTEAAPATFALKIPAHYVPPHLSGIGELAHRLEIALEYARAAGIHARLELSVPLHREEMAAIEGQVRTGLSWNAGSRHELRESMRAEAILKSGEVQPQKDLVGVAGTFDQGYFDTATFVALTTEGIFDYSDFDRALLEADGREGIMDNSYFDAGEFEAESGEGVFDRTYLETSRFDKDS